MANQIIIVKDITHTSNDKHINEDIEEAFIIKDNNNEIVEEISQYIKYKTLKGE
jgi:signal recognition particle GTPase